MEFEPHFTGEKQGAMHDTVKKKITHDIRQKYKYGDDVHLSIEEIKRVDFQIPADPAPGAS